MIKYLKRVYSLSDDRLAKKTLKQQIQDDHYNCVSQTGSNQKSDYRIKNLIKAKFIEDLKQSIANCLNQRKKLRTYAQFKSITKSEKYLEYIKNFAVRSCYSRFRLGVHDLEIERGRFNCKPLPIESRICKQCQINKVDEVEDEKHFLMQCPAYSLQRSKLINKITQKFPRFSLLDESEKFVWILSQDDSEAIH